MKTYLTEQVKKGPWAIGGKIALSTVLVISLSGCWMQRDEDFRTPWQWEPTAGVTSSHDVIWYRVGRVSLTQSDKNLLRELYFEFSHLDKVSVRLGVSHLGALGKSSQMYARVIDLQRYLQSLGIPSSRIEIVDKIMLPDHFLPEYSSEKGRKEAIVVIFDEYRAIPPKCPGWDQRMNGRVPPEGEANFGCTTQSNFAHMVADPRTLKKGRKLGNSDGARSALAIKDYRTDKVKAIKVQQLKTESAGGSGESSSSESSEGGSTPVG